MRIFAISSLEVLYVKIKRTEGTSAPRENGFSVRFSYETAWKFFRSRYVQPKGFEHSNKISKYRENYFEPRLFLRRIGDPVSSFLRDDEAW